MNRLPLQKQVDILSMMIEGNSIRSTERMTGVHRDTIMRLTTRIGEGCVRFLDGQIRGIRSQRVTLCASIKASESRQRWRLD